MRTWIALLLLCLVLPATAFADWIDDPFLGVVLSSVPPRDKKLTKTSSLYPPKGAWVRDVYHKSPAAARLKPKYVITAIQGDQVDTPKAAIEAIKKHQGSTAISVEYLLPELRANRMQWRDTRSADIKPLPFGQWCVSVMEKTDDPTRPGWSQYTHVEPIQADGLGGGYVSPFFNASAEGKISFAVNFGWIAKDWLFIRSVTIRIGDQTIEREMKLADIDQRIEVGSVSELCTVVLTEKELEAFAGLEKATAVAFALNGKSSRHTFTLEDVNFEKFQQTGAAALWLKRSAAANRK